MSLSDDVQKLSKDLDAVIDTIAELSRRFEAIEAQVREQAEKQGRGVGPEFIEAPAPEEIQPAPPVVTAVDRREAAPPEAPPSVAKPEAAVLPPSRMREEAARAPIEVKPLVPLSVNRYIQEWIDSVRRKTRELGWELSLGTYWLPRVAVVCIAIAVVFFTALAINWFRAQWAPYLRVAAGYVVCAGLLLLAWRTEKKYQGFARVLYGGGFAVMYYVTYATHYVSFARIFDSPAVTLILLAMVVLAWALAAQVRKSKIIAVLVTVLGHLTIALSTVTLVRPGPFSMAGILFLSAGSAFFLLRNCWYYVACLGMVGSYVNHLLVLAYSRGGNPYVDFAGSMSVLTAFFLIFALAELFAPEELRRRRVPTWFRSLFVTANTAAFFAVGTFLVAHFDFTRAHQDLLQFGLAAVLLLLGLAYLRLRAADPLFNVYITKAVVFVTWGLATRYGGSSLSAWLSIEALALLLSARRSGLVVTRVLAFAVGAIAFCQSIYVALNGHVPYGAPDYPAHLIQAALGVLSFLAASQLYQRTDWKIRSPRSAPLSQDLLTICWQLDLVAEPPAGLESLIRPAEGLLLPYLYALGGAALFVGHAWALADYVDQFAAISIFACALMIAAGALRAKPFGLASVAVVLLAALPIGTEDIWHHWGAPVYVAVLGLAGLALVALGSEQSYGGRRVGLAFHQAAVCPYLLYGTVAWLTGLALVVRLAALDEVYALMAAAVVAAALSLVLHPLALAGISTAYLLWASVMYIPQILPHTHFAPEKWRVIAWVLVTVSVLGDRFFSFFRQRVRIAPVLGAIVVVNAWVVLLCYFEADIRPEWQATAVALASYGFLVYGGLSRSPAGVAVAVAGALLASARHSMRAFDLHTLESGLVVGFVLLALFWIVSERLLARFRPALEEHAEWLKDLIGIDFKERDYALAPIALSTALLLILLHRIPHLAPANLTLITIGWFALAAGLFVVSLAFHQRAYRYAGLAVIALSLARVFFIDMKEQEALLRVAAFAVLGTGLLAISYGYFRWMAALRARQAADTASRPEQRPNQEE